MQMPLRKSWDIDSVNKAVEAVRQKGTAYKLASETQRPQRNFERTALCKHEKAHKIKANHR
jgi:hypothetical protein